MLGEEKRDDFAMRMRFARTADPQETLRRAEIALWIAAITLLWLVSVSLLLGLGVADGHHFGDRSAAFALAAGVAVLLPFLAAIIATRHGRPWLGGTYMVLTLAMLLPAVGFLGLG
ncbi:hypothetical protein [Mangrovihabitans endophyticus]|uniref:Uncharacterized protein n=1 Tax=Mangrovihabitans endophyticus TaxID=1751298 RepID=A0A8J3BXZ4_9ACTN|nr:hypothetical protein [Mangrovihabitans endophyticus]GGK80413.1 hypothetical protein GCM10012284_12900 [Mangrovihabitans endophyticus]